MRRRVAFAAARLLYTREVDEYLDAKRRAARAVGLRRPGPADLPSNAEIRDQLRAMVRVHQPDPAARLGPMRRRALVWMRRLSRYHPKLIGSVLTGEVREGSDIDLHLFTNHVSLVVDDVERAGHTCRWERKRIECGGETRVFNHVHVDDDDPVELTVYPLGDLGRKFRSSLTGRAIETASITRLEQMIALEHTPTPGRRTVAEPVDPAARFLGWLAPLADVMGDPRWHPEGDTLFHSLQVYDHAVGHHPYDAEFLTAALLHDIGKAVDVAGHAETGADMISGIVAGRVVWLVRHHMDAHRIADGTAPPRLARRLRRNPWFDDLMTLHRCDLDGRRPDATPPTIDTALDHLRMIGAFD